MFSIITASKQTQTVLLTFLNFTTTLLLRRFFTFFRLNNPIMKNLIMAGMAARTATQFLLSSNMDLVRHSCLLLYNCSKTEQYRQTIASYGAIQLLLDLLRPNPTPPIYRNVQVLTNAVGMYIQKRRSVHRVYGAL